MTRVLGADRVPGRVHDHDRGLRRLHGGRPPSCPRASPRRSTRRCAALERRTGKTARRSATTRCSSRCARAPACRCPGCSTPSSTSASTTSRSRASPRSTGSERFAWDSYRRFVQMFGNVVRGIPSASFEQALQEAKDRAGVGADTELGAEELRELTATFKRLFEEATGERFPLGPARAAATRRSPRCSTHGTGSGRSPTGESTASPTTGAPRSTSSRWSSETAARRSGSGVAFSRDERTGEPTPSGDFLPNAQGEDVVAGTRDPEDLAALADRVPEAHAQLLADLSRLESHYKDMQDVEFTIEEGRLFLLQTRAAKRPAQAAVRFAVDSVQRGAADPRGGAADDRRRGARRAASPGLRPLLRVRGADHRGRGRARGGQGRDRPRARRRRCAAPPTART